MSDPIDLFGGLRIKRSKNYGNRSARTFAEFTAPSLVFHADDAAIAAELASAVESTISENLLRGLGPDGSVLPGVDSDTLRRRAYREAQGTRAGGASPRITNKGDRGAALRNWNKRFKTAKLGMFAPIPGASTFGVESGMLARSIKVVREGDAFRLFFAVARARLDRTGSNAVLRVFKRLGGIWPAGASRQPKIQEALRSAQSKLFAASAVRALSTVLETLNALSDLAETAEDSDG